MVDVIASHRPQVCSLALGAITFPDFDRGSYVPDDPERDGSSWNLEVPLERLLSDLPSLERLIVQARSMSYIGRGSYTAPRLRHLVLREQALNPAVISALARGIFPELESLELWLGNYEYSWDGSASDLLPLLNSPGMGALRHLALVSDLADAVINVLAQRKLPLQLETIDLSHGVLTSNGAARLCKHWSHFSKLRRLRLTGNAISMDAAAELKKLGGDVIELGWQRAWLDGEAWFEPPLVSLYQYFSSL